MPREMEAVMNATRDSDHVLIGNPADPVVMRSCDAKRCRHIRLVSLLVGSVGIGLTAWTGHEAILAVAVLAIAFLAQMFIC
jgi:hypothetical protein